MEFVWGALAFALCNPRKIEIETRGACDLSEDGRACWLKWSISSSPGFHALARAAARS